MPTPLPATLHTVYAELLERCTIENLVETFPPAGSFYKRQLKGRGYWYYKPSMHDDPQRRSKYVGPDSPELQAMIARHAEVKAERKERRSMVVALQRAGLPGPDGTTGRVLAALAAAGVFRLRGVVVGSVAYQTYGGLLGQILSARNAATSDLDVAQFLSISMHVDDAIDVPFEEVLKSVDPGFRAIGALNGRHATRYALGTGKYRVEVLTPNEGPDSDAPVRLPALQSDGQPLRFLDFLIHDEVKAVVLQGDGILVNVPAPERFAIHKLLVSRLRLETAESQAKAEKDLRQATELIDILIEQRPYELRDLWHEAWERGPKWQQYLNEAVGLIERRSSLPPVKERLLALVGK